jgi:hypothetical protein
MGGSPRHDTDREGFVGTSNRGRTLRWVIRSYQKQRHPLSLSLGFRACGIEYVCAWSPSRKWAGQPQLHPPGSCRRISPCFDLVGVWPVPTKCLNRFHFKLKFQTPVRYSALLNLWASSSDFASGCIFRSLMQVSIGSSVCISEAGRVQRILHFPRARPRRWLARLVKHQLGRQIIARRAGGR